MKANEASINYYEILIARVSSEEGLKEQIEPLSATLHGFILGVDTSRKIIVAHIPAVNFETAYWQVAKALWSGYTIPDKWMS